MQPTDRESSASPAAPEAEASSLPTTAIQVAAYAGVAMGLVGTLALVGLAGQPSDTTILVIAVGVTAVLFAAGAAIGSDPRPPNQRLRSVLWFAALFGWAAVIEAFLIVVGVDLGGRARQVLSAALAAAAAVALWMGLRRSLQMIGMFSGLFGVLSAATFPEPDPFGQLDLVAPAVLWWVFGAAWMAAGARGALRPGRTAVVLGTITVLVSPLALAAQGSPSETTATVIELWILATSVGCLIVGTWLEDRAVQGLAIIGLLMGVAVLVGDVLAGSRGGSIAAMVIGVALLAGAIIAIRSSRPAVGGPLSAAEPSAASTLPEPPSD